MPTQGSQSFKPGTRVLDPVEPQAKAVFIKPQLIYRGTVVDLTATFGGSLTPEERIDQDCE
jgi:hypothetical protein